MPASFSVCMAVDAETGYLNYLTKVESSKIGIVCWVFKENSEKLFTIPQVTMSTFFFFLLWDLCYILVQMTTLGTGRSFWLLVLPSQSPRWIERNFCKTLWFSFEIVGRNRDLFLFSGYLIYISNIWKIMVIITSQTKYFPLLCKRGMRQLKFP